MPCPSGQAQAAQKSSTAGALPEGHGMDPMVARRFAPLAMG